MLRGSGGAVVLLGRGVYALEAVGSEGEGDCGCIEGERGESGFGVRVEAVRMKMKMLPSRRGEATANVVSGAGHELPSYS
jgi:hypothetical protein